MRRKIAIVTGGNRGIGLEITRQLAEKSVRVALCSRSKTYGDRIALEMRDRGLDVTCFRLDVSKEESVRACINEIEAAMGVPDILVNNAGIFPEGRNAGFLDHDLLTFYKTVNTNLLGAVRMCHAVVPLMKRLRYGRIVNISSGLGQMQTMSMGSPAYRVSKASLNAFTKTLAVELAGSGILVNAMSPGWVKTDMGGADAPRTVEEAADTAVWLALLPNDGATGGFFRDRKEIPW